MRALYKKVWSARLCKDQYILDTTADIRATPAERPYVCLFKLSDLGLWKSFPRYLLKRGFEIELRLNLDFARININPGTVNACDAGAITKLSDLNVDLVNDIATSYYSLESGVAQIYTTQPDE